MKTSEKEKAIQLRRQGMTYTEILQQVPVAKSTLAQWLGSVGLSNPQKQRITKKRLDAARRGAQMRRNMRIAEVKDQIVTGKKNIASLSARELWLIGVALYWAEGTKQHEHIPSSGVMFGNSDVTMISVFLRWLKLMQIVDSDICFELYVHDTKKSEAIEFRDWWAKQLGVPRKKITKIYFKKGNPKTNRHNVADLYHGLLRIKVKSSTTLNRRINGWVVGIVAALGSGVTGNTPAFGAGDSRFDP